MKTAAPHVLLVNPWIDDFASYDFWAQPYGLLSLAAILRRGGCRVSYVDCLDRFHPRAPPADPSARGGRGPYRKRPLPKPPGLADVPRTFSRYGISVAWLRRDLEALDPPDLILVTSGMTYWASGVAATIAATREVFAGTPIWLGGVYATLCEGHARAHAGADRVLGGPAEDRILALVGEATGHAMVSDPDPGDLDSLPYPAFDLRRRLAYVPLLTSRGCPYRCAYCASSHLMPGFRRRSPDAVFAEIRHWHQRYGVRDFAFYDDALLVDADNHILPLLEQIAAYGRPLRFHTPNALHIRHIDRRVAEGMAAAGFATIRLGLETTAFGAREDLDAKVTAEEFRRAAACLREAGLRADRIGAYLLVGLPGQRLSTVEHSVAVVRAAGITPVAAYYSPIPHTPLWEAAKRASRYDLEADPVFSNNAIWPCSQEPFSWSRLSNLKALIQS